jgi:CO dehydrogenase maturation factor
MKTMIALAGKGGTGKTTLAALIIRLILENKTSLLAIDADPNNNLWQALCIEQGQTIMDIVDSITKNKESIPSGMTKDRYVDLRIQEVLQESEKFDFLSMGKPEGPGCYCYANNLLRDLIEKVSRGYDTIVVDNEAGMEHLSRRLMRKIDFLFVVSDFSQVGVRSAANIAELIKGLDIAVGKKFIVVNKVTGDINRLKQDIDKTGLDFLGAIPYDKTLEELSIKGRPIFELGGDAVSLKALKEVLSGIKSIVKEPVWS